MPMIEVNDAEYYYELHGTGNPLVLISGYTCDHIFWLPILVELSKYYQLLIFDNRGVGRTTDNGNPLSINLMADDIITMCEKLDLKKPHIVGHSMGGSIAQTIAARYPEKISKLALLTSSAKWREVMLFAFETLLQMRKDNINFDLIFAASLPWIFSNDFLANKQKINLYKKSIVENPYPQTISDQARQFNMLREFDGREQLNNIHAPTLVISGLQDIVSLSGDSQLIANQIQQAKLVTLDCAHGITIEVPQKLSEILLSFLQ